MKLLIVAENAQKFAEAVNWADVGIDKVSTASDAMAARADFKNGVPDILLSEIELPVENGISLYKWVKGMEYPTRAIFLAESSFDYLKDAFAIGAEDYLQKPLSAAKIRDAVAHAANEIREDEIRDKDSQIAGRMKDREQMIIAGLWKGYLNGIADRQILEDFTALPKDTEEGTLILAQIIHMNARDKEKWNSRLLQNAMKNMVEEVFNEREYKRMIVLMQPFTFSITLQNKEKTEADETKKITNLLNYLCGVCSMYMPFKLDCYVEGTHVQVADMPAAWDRLLSRQHAAVQHRGGVCWYQDTDIPGRQQSLMGTLQMLRMMKEWQRLAADGKLHELERTINTTMDELLAQNKMSRETLVELQQGFVQTILASDTEGYIGTLFEREEMRDLYRESIEDADCFREFIHYIVENHRSDPEQMSHRDMVRKIVDYVHLNLGSDIHQDNISELVMVNADYANRIFKKETGQNIKAYITHEKMTEAKRLLRTTELPISYIATQLGFSNFSHFSAAYRKEMNHSPQEERQSAGKMSGQIVPAEQNKE